jgi:hypothetical protein
LACLTLFNLDTYRFFARRRGVWFGIRCIPMHWLYHLYNGLSFAAGSALSLWQRKG